MKRITMFALLLGVLTCASYTFAQFTPAPVLLVDGSVNPSQIPDVNAYRAVFVHMQDSNTVSTLAQKVSRIGFTSSADAQTFQQTMLAFSTEYTTSQADFVPGPTTPSFDDSTGLTITQTYMNSLNSSLTSGGAAQLNTYVQNEKANMKMYQ
jgi:hypothetical protein